MSSNYGYDANGWEREPFPARDEFAEPRRPRSVDARVTAYQRAKAEHPRCVECCSGKGTLSPGPGHCKDHDRHCSAAPCW